MRIDIEALAVSFGGRQIVADVDLTVPNGAFVAIVGPNGSGKTTLLRAVYHAVRAEHGAIMIGGEDVRTLQPREQATRRSVVPQFQHGASGLTAGDIVGTGRHAHLAWWSTEGDADRAAVRDALERTGAAALADRVFDTLSGGERQRVLLARALAQDAATLLLDEPANHLDARAQLELLTLLDALPTTRVAVLHDLDHAVAHADLVAVMHRGRLVATGAPSAVLTNDLTARVFGVRSTILTHPITGRPHLVTGPMEPGDAGSSQR